MKHIRPEELPARQDMREALARFCREARDAAPESVQNIIIYGSTARGEAGPDSDLDIWVDWIGDETAGRSLLGDLAARIFWETGVLVSVHVVADERRRQLASWRSPFYERVHAEGLAVDG